MSAKLFTISHGDRFSHKDTNPYTLTPLYPYTLKLALSGLSIKNLHLSPVTYHLCFCYRLRDKHTAKHRLTNQDGCDEQQKPVCIISSFEKRLSLFSLVAVG